MESFQEKKRKLLKDTYSTIISSQDSDDEDSETIFRELLAEVPNSQQTLQHSSTLPVRSVVSTFGCWMILGTIPWLISLAKDGTAFGESKGRLFRISLICATTGSAFIFARVLSFILVVLVRSSMFLTTRFLYYLKPLEVYISLFLGSLLSFTSMFAFEIIVINGKNLDSLDPQIQEYLFLGLTILTFATFMLTFFTFLTWKFGSSFIRSAFYERIIQDLVCEFAILSILNSTMHVTVSNLDGGLVLTPSSSATSAKSNVLEDFPINLRQLVSQDLSNRKLIRLVEYIKIHPDLSIIAYLASKSNLNHNKHINHFENKKQLATNLKVLSTEMYQKLCSHSSDGICVRTLSQMIPLTMAEKVMSYWDRNQDQVLSEKEFYRAVVQAVNGRKALSFSLIDAEQQLEKLASVARMFAIFISGLGSLVISGKDASKVLATTSTFLVAAAVGIGDTLKSLLSSIVFLFIAHPFDIGDRVLVDGEIYLVHRISIMSTVLRKNNNAEVYFPNSELAKKLVINLRRSPDQNDFIDINVAFHTPPEKLLLFEETLKAFLSRQKKNFYPTLDLFYKSAEDGNRLNMSLNIRHRSNFQNQKKYRERRSHVLLKVKQILETLEIDYSLPIAKIGISGNSLIPNFL